MATAVVAEALARAKDVFGKRPSAALHDDAPGVARWDGGVRTVTCHPAGHEVATDMPSELGGAGGEVSPGWMVRAGIAACTATSIAMTAAMEGIELDVLEVRAESRSDTRGVLGLTEADGAAVYPGPMGLAMHVRIAAAGVSADRLRALVEQANARAPMSAIVRDALPMPLKITLADT